MNTFYKLKLILFCLILTNLPTMAQSDYDIRLTFDTLDCMNKVGCFNVQLRSADGDEWGLAGQNYRLYYDASLASWQSGVSTLSSAYQGFSLIQDVQDVDASTTDGNLAFESTLGFLNYTMDLANPSIGGITLPTDGSWVTTSQLCFALEDALLDDPSTCLEVVWARDSLTNDYATSFVEVSEWVQTDSTQMADGQLYDGLDAADGDDACLTNICNPPNQYDIRLAFDTLDCMNKVGCFNVQLRSADGDEWGLAGQNYRLYYDASLASWQSGVSTLSSAYQGFSLIQDVQDVDASTTGSNLAFESTLGFLNYTMDLANPSVGGITLPTDGSWVTTSQLCFALEDALLDNPSTCLEVVWARDSLTNDYATSFVEVSEWVQTDSTQMADGQLYDGLDTADGSSSCFDNLCLYDYGDLPDTSSTTNRSDYQTLSENNGPVHLISSALFLGLSNDGEPNGIPDSKAQGDGIEDDGIIIFNSLDLRPTGTFRLPFSANNTTGDTAFVKAWIDWNADGDFDKSTEVVANWNDGTNSFPQYMEVNIPTNVVTSSQIGLRIRISNQSDMIPYGILSIGEVEDYLLKVECAPSFCIPVQIVIKKG